MMFRFGLLFSSLCGVSALDVSSKAGSKLMSQARRLNQNWEEDFTWAAKYSVKFQGCHHSLAWNEEGNGEDDLKIYNQRLVRFRLCPTDSCDGSNASGCDSSSAGEYVVSLAAFVDAYTEAKMEAQEYECEQATEYCENYNCANANDDEACVNQCLQQAGKDYCVEEEGEEQFEVQRYIECAEYNGGNRRLNDNWNGQYFIGPYCSDEGDKIFLGMFMDETCSNSANDNIYSTYTYGRSLPYSSGTGESIVGLDCVSCKEPQDNQNQNDQQDADEVIEMCENLYEAAGKCESNLNGVKYYTNEDACNFIEGIKITRSNGTVQVHTSPSKIAIGFIGVFVVSTMLLGAYVYYLKSKLDRARVNLTSE